MIFELLKRSKDVPGDTSGIKGYPTNALAKTFQLMVEIDSSLSDADKAIVQAASRAGSAKIQVSNDQKHWHDLYPTLTATKGAGETTGGNYWDPDLAEMWGYHRIVPVSLGAGLVMSVFMCM
jgi:hypothetical protein